MPSGDLSFGGEGAAAACEVRSSACGVQNLAHPSFPAWGRNQSNASAFILPATLLRYARAIGSQNQRRARRSRSSQASHGMTTQRHSSPLCILPSPLEGEGPGGEGTPILFSLATNHSPLMSGSSKSAQVICTALAAAHAHRLGARSRTLHRIDRPRAPQRGAHDLSRLRYRLHGFSHWRWTRLRRLVRTGALQSRKNTSLKVSMPLSQTQRERLNKKTHRHYLWAFLFRDCATPDGRSAHGCFEPDHARGAFASWATSV